MKFHPFTLQGARSLISGCLQGRRGPAPDSYHTGSAPSSCGLLGVSGSSPLVRTPAVRFWTLPKSQMFSSCGP